MAKPAAALDSLDMYLQEAGNYCLLERQEEIGLAKQIEEKGNKILMAVFSYDPDFLINHLAGKLPQKKVKKIQAVHDLFAEAVKDEDDFSARIESVREMIPFVSAYRTVAESYSQKLNQDEEQTVYGSILEGQSSLLMEDELAAKVSERRNHLEELISAWSEPRDTMVKHNLRFVIHLAKKYASQGMGLLDCIQEGNQGLYRGVDGFDYRRGVKFSTYASDWVRQAIQRMIDNNGRTIRVPVYNLTKMRAIDRAEKVLRGKLGRGDFTDQEIAAQLLWVKAERKAETERKKKKLQDIQIKEPTAKEIAAEAVKVAEVSQMIYETDAQNSLDDTVGEYAGSRMNMVPDTDAASPEEETYQSILAERMEKALGKLSPRYRYIIQARFNLGSNAEPTLTEIAQKYRLSRERIRQIEQKGLRRLERDPDLRNFFLNK